MLSAHQVDLIHYITCAPELHWHTAISCMGEGNAMCTHLMNFPTAKECAGFVDLLVDYKTKAVRTHSLIVEKEVCEKCPPCPKKDRGHEHRSEQIDEWTEDCPKTDPCSFKTTTDIRLCPEVNIVSHNPGALVWSEWRGCFEDQLHPPLEVAPLPQED